MSAFIDFGRGRFSGRPKQRITRYIIVIAVIITTIISYRKSLFHFRTYSTIQYDFKGGMSMSLAQPERLEAVKREFIHAWTGYKRHSWMKDSLRPLSGGSQNQFCGWSATLVDSLDTLYIMGLTDEFNEAVEAATTINFKQSAEDCDINLFESTIRYVGGMLAAYDLSQDERLLPKLVELGDLLHSAFNSTNGMPCTHCDLSEKNNATIVPGAYVPLADVASLSLEFSRLSQITGDPKYSNTVAFMTEKFQNAQMHSTLPGLWPEYVDVSSVDGPDATFMSKSIQYSLGALSDSAYEYLVKGHLLLGSQTRQYADMWKLASIQIKNNLLFRAYIPQWQDNDVLFSGVASKNPDQVDPYLEPRTQHLACFAGGMFAMSSRIFGIPEDLDIGAALTQGCVWAYENSPTGIMPETFSLVPCPAGTTDQCAWDDEAWGKSLHRTGYPLGYVMSIDTHYGLRPEAIESVFILYRVTGDAKWRDLGWKMFEKIIEHTRTDYGHAALSTVMELRESTTVENGQSVKKMVAAQKDEMESFWLAETLKYFYLLYSEPELISLDEYVLNTEAHPFRLSDGVRGFP